MSQIDEYARDMNETYNCHVYTPFARGEAVRSHLQFPYIMKLPSLLNGRN
jgi:hypothetical protein